MNQPHPHADFGQAVDRLRGSATFRALREEQAGGRLTGLPAAACGWVLGQLALELRRPVVLVMPHEAEAQSAAAGARLGLPPSESNGAPSPAVIHYASPALTPFQETDPALRLLAGHARAFEALIEARPALVVVDAPALLRPLPEPESWIARLLSMAVGEEIDRGRLLEALTSSGYERAEQVGQVGEFAVRGAVVDVFSPAHAGPVRIEFFGDEVVTLRDFDPGDQRTRSSLDRCRILPILPFPQTTAAVAGLRDKLEGRMSPLAVEEAERRLKTLAAGGMPAGWSEWLVMNHPDATTVLEWPGTEQLVLWDRPTIDDVLTRAWEDLENDASTRARRIGFELSAEDVAVPARGLVDGLDRARWEVAVWVDQPRAATATGGLETPLDFRGSETENLRRTPERLATAVERAEQAGLSVWLTHEGDGSVARRFLQQHELNRRVRLLPGSLDSGFALPEAGIAIFAEGQFYLPPRVRRRPPLSMRRQREAFLGGLKDLKVGDYVVHQEHGIGRYAGIRRIQDATPADDGLPDWAARQRETTRVTPTEVLEIVYRDDRTLLLPIDRVGLVSRFAGIEGVEPRLDRLGGASWQSRRNRVRAGVRKLAVDLLDLYANRSTSEATPMPAGGPLLQLFEQSFPYQETPDQQRAIDQVREDLERDRPMDRLLCGDVGFGKTEVAMRAAMQAVEAGCQVAVLAPTTILADQHGSSFRRRFRGLPVNVEVLSRFRSDAEVEKLLEELASGGVDILIGTHRLLGEVPFRSLGLLVIDEEQRFGVAQKERLVEARKNLHVLSMSATPVPRTLQLALGGVRDLSLIETPPRDRMAVETAVVPFSRELVREAAEYERGRGGQTYYLHNRVESIDDVASSLREWLPEFRITVGHGQLPEDELAQRMHRFQDGEYDVLLATTIIANGIDIPNVNTMLIHDAHRFGLGELYQLRGRVGRSDRLGFCYLMVPTDRAVSETARRRLATIREFTELGAGFRVAARDLEIRGAGDVLGAEQSGHIASVGVETYLKLLEDAVSRLKGEEPEEEISCELELPGGAAIPESYVQEPGLRLELYQRLGSSDADLDELREEMQDRYGPVPAEAELLIAQHHLRRQAERLRVQSISYQRGALHLRFRADARVDVERLVGWMEDDPRVDFSPGGVLSVTEVAPTEAIAVSQELLTKLWADV